MVIGDFVRFKTHAEYEHYNEPFQRYNGEIGVVAMTGEKTNCVKVRFGSNLSEWWSPNRLVYGWAMVDCRTEPGDYNDHVAHVYATWSKRYRDGECSRAVFEATLFSLGWRGQDIVTEVHLNFPKVKDWLDR